MESLQSESPLDYDEIERELKVAQMRADIENKVADSTYTAKLTSTEPTKVMISLALAVAAVVGSVAGRFGYVLGRGH